MKKLLALLLCLTMVAVPAMATAEDGQAADWAIEYLVDAESLGLLTADNSPRLYETVTADDLAAAEAIIESKLSLVGLEAKCNPSDLGDYAVFDGTRGNVLNQLSNQVSIYDWNGKEYSTELPLDILYDLNVIKGDNGALALERPCTVQELMVFATRVILNGYDAVSAGTKGLLWKVTDETTGSTLYLMGTYHVDRGNMYPMHESVRNALLSSDQVYFELDFLDYEGLMYYMNAMVYPEGEGLKDNIPAELYEYMVEIAPDLGLDEATLNTYKPWALASTISNLLTQDESTGDSALPVDSYLFYLAYMAGLPTDGIETYEMQTGIFDDLSQEYQTAYLYSMAQQYALSLDENANPDDTSAAAFDALQEPWASRDAAGFDAVYGKDESLAAFPDDELNTKLFLDRDPAMIESALAFLRQENTTTFLAVGAGHMVGTGGIVAGLEAEGYTVAVVE